MKSILIMISNGQANDSNIIIDGEITELTLESSESTDLIYTITQMISVDSECCSYKILVDSDLGADIRFNLKHDSVNDLIQKLEKSAIVQDNMQNPIYTPLFSLINSILGRL